MPGVCTHCGSSEIDTDAARGDAVCTNCGSVLEDQIIVSEVQFAENAGGSSSVIGQFVSSEGQKGHSFGPGFHHGFGKESRAVTLQNGKKQIQLVGAQLKLNNHCIETAFNFYKMAVARRITRGRKNSHVIAACLYMVCRVEGTSHMLLDFSDALQVNVYTLGRTYLALSRELCINIPALDPCIYIQRFAHKLEFGDKTHEVAMTALRLVQRMKRDWIHAGRRPSGLCGAALLVAARLHDFGRSVKDMIKIAKVCESTLRKRLTEFEDTPSGQLTIDEFQTIDLEEEHDPPCYLAGKKKAKLLAQLEEAGKLGEISSEIAMFQDEIEKALDCPLKSKKDRKSIDPEEVEKDRLEQNEAEKFLREEVYKFGDDFQVASACEDSDVPITGDHGASSSFAEEDDDVPDDVVERLEHEELASVTMLDDSFSVCHTPGPRPTPASLGLRETIEECMAVRDEMLQVEGNGELDLEGIDDEEIDRLYILTREEVVVKARMWLIANSDYLKEQREKRQKEKEELESGETKPEKKKKKPRKKTTIQATTAGEAIEKIVQEKKISSKINYDVLRSLNSDPSEKYDPDAQDKLMESPVIIESGPVVPSSLERRFKRSAAAADIRTESPASKRNAKIAPKIEPAIAARPPSPIIESGPVVESGPIEYAGLDVNEADELSDDDQEISAARLMGQDNYHDEYDEDYY